MMGAATEKARLPRFSFVLGIESCCEVDVLRMVHNTTQGIISRNNKAQHRAPTQFFKLTIVCHSTFSCK